MDDDTSRTDGGMTRRFVPLSLDKHEWHPSPLLGQIVLVSTVDAGGTIDVAPKSWVSMAAFAGPVLGFGCSERHTTYRNIRETDEFAISIPDTRLARLAWDMGRRPSSERADLAGIAFAPARVIRAPLVADCPAHLECRYVSHVTFDDGEVFIFGRIVAAQVDVRCADGDATAAYATLDPAFFLEERLFAGLARPQAVERQHPAGYPDEPPGRRAS